MLNELDVLAIRAKLIAVRAEASRLHQKSHDKIERQPAVGLDDLVRSLSCCAEHQRRMEHLTAVELCLDSILEEKPEISNDGVEMNIQNWLKVHEDINARHPSNIAERN
jgi:hypothetical protein